MAKDSPGMHGYKVRQSLKRKLWCAIFAEDAFRKTKEIAEEYIASGFTSKSPLHFACISSAAITYSRFFISSDSMVVLPNKFSSFPDESLRVSHLFMLTSRNEVYAHTDATLSMYKIVIDIEHRGANYVLGYRIHQPNLTDAFFPRLVALSDFQMKRAREYSLEIIHELLPTDSIHSLLSAERSPYTTINVNWPKPLDPSITEPPNTW